jgi:hypothetical protein
MSIALIQRNAEGVNKAAFECCDESFDARRFSPHFTLYFP